MLSVLGFIDVQGKRIFVNRLIDPLENPDAHEGRFYFTLAHEVGHYVLHKELIEEFIAQASFFDTDEDDPQPAILCRHPDDDPIQRRPYVEQHADKFAAAILMPPKLISKAWHGLFDTDKPLTLEEIAEHGDSSNNLMDVQRASNLMLDQLAEQFKVSRTAMRIRLEKLGLLVKGDQPVFL